MRHSISISMGVHSGVISHRLSATATHCIGVRPRRLMRMPMAYIITVLLWFLRFRIRETTAGLFAAKIFHLSSLRKLWVGRGKFDERGHGITWLSD